MSGSEAEYVFLGTLCPVEVHLTTCLGIQVGKQHSQKKEKNIIFSPECLSH